MGFSCASDLFRGSLLVYGKPSTAVGSNVEGEHQNHCSAVPTLTRDSGRSIPAINLDKQQLELVENAATSSFLRFYI